MIISFELVIHRWLRKGQHDINRVNYVFMCICAGAENIAN